MALISANVAVFAWELVLQAQSPVALQQFLERFGVVPSRLLGSPDPEQLLTVLTSMFLHGGLLHLGGNMLYLWIFGNNVEDTLGHGFFTAFYALCGVGAMTLQVLVDPGGTVTTIGASGAIAGVLGAYLILFPHATVDTLVFLGYFIRMVRVPAVIVLGLWFVLQLFQGVASVGLQAQGGVAWFAHVGGFVTGAGLVLLLSRRRAGERAGPER